MHVGGDGSTKKTFRIHRQCPEKKPFLQNALKEPWEEVDKNGINLPDCSPRIFPLYVRWVYSGKIDESLESGFADTQAIYELLAETYVLGNFLCDPRFCNALIDSFLAVFDRIKALPSPTLHNHVFHQTHEESKLNTPLNEFIVFEYGGRGLTIHRDDLPQLVLCEGLQREPSRGRICRWSRTIPPQ